MCFLDGKRASLAAGMSLNLSVSLSTNGENDLLLSRFVTKAEARTKREKKIT